MLFDGQEGTISIKSTHRMHSAAALSACILLMLSCSVPPDVENQAPRLEPVSTGALLPILPSDKPSVPLQCADAQTIFITGLQVLAEPPMPEPGARQPFRDPTFGTCLVRVTDRDQDPSPQDSSAGLKNEYSRVQAYNADETLLLVRGIDSTWYIYDARSLQPLAQVPLDVDPRWSADDPFIIHYSSGTSLMSYNVRSGGQLTLHDFAQDLPGQEISVIWTRYEGSPSYDSRIWGLMAEDADWLTSAFLVYDLPSGKVAASLDTRSWSPEAREVDSVTISPLGSYFLVYLDKYCEPGQLGTQTDPCGLMVYDRDLQHGRGLLRLIGHSDTALDAQGREVLVYQDIDTDHISMLDLASGAVTPLFPIDFSHTPIGLHISGRASRLPGWVVISTHDGNPASYTWMDDSVFAIELKPDGRIIRLAHTHSLVDENMEHDYWAEPQATVNHDFTRILFTTNWGRSGSPEVEMYVILLPEDWLNLLP